MTIALTISARYLATMDRDRASASSSSLLIDDRGWSHDIK